MPCDVPAGCTHLQTDAIAVRHGSGPPRSNSWNKSDHIPATIDEGAGLRKVFQFADPARKAGPFSKRAGANHSLGITDITAQRNSGTSSQTPPVLAAAAGPPG